MLRKNSFTVAEQACNQIRDFKKLYEEPNDKVHLSEHSANTMTNYAPKTLKAAKI
jgi:hypothetical protein